MVKDFNELAIFKEWINNNLDHTYIGNATDPITLQCQQEGLKVYIIDHASTAEYLAQHLYEVFSTMMPIASIQLFETPTASVVYP
ncbi:6-carboxytetrahydropterin synthase [Patescibacteria group bacterium]|nr:6-carboxytetrahydropterin synthase [Patescibacteria group bacterium]